MHMLFSVLRKLNYSDRWHLHFSRILYPLGTSRKEEAEEFTVKKYLLGS